MYILEELYNKFYEPSPQHSLNLEVNTNHQELIISLSKADRKKVLKIIDNLMLITLLQSKDSFICGFKLAMNLHNELNNYIQSDYVAENLVMPSLLNMEVQDEHN